MKRVLWIFFALFLGACSSLPSFAPELSPTAVTYTATDLGAGASSYATAVSPNGTVAVFSRVSSSEYRISRWTAAGGLTALGTANVQNIFSPMYMNDQGVIAGQATTDCIPVPGTNYCNAVQHPFVWTPARGFELLTLGGDADYLKVMNRAGMVLGTGKTASGTWRAFVWTA